MIAAAVVPWDEKTRDGYLIAEKRSGSVFNPSTGAWEPFVSPLQPADINRLMVRPGPPMAKASLTAWPFAGFARLWADTGDPFDGDQVVAFRFELDAQGNFTRPGVLPPLWMDQSPAGTVQYADGSTMKPVARDGNGNPTVPVSS